MTNRHFLTLTLLLGASALTTPALAQTAQPGTDRADAIEQTDAADTGDLGDIVVTAERRSENLGACRCPSRW